MTLLYLYEILTYLVQTILVDLSQQYQTLCSECPEFVSFNDGFCISICHWYSIRTYITPTLLIDIVTSKLIGRFMLSMGIFHIRWLSAIILGNVRFSSWFVQIYPEYRTHGAYTISLISSLSNRQLTLASYFVPIILCLSFCAYHFVPIIVNQ